MQSCCPVDETVFIWPGKARQAELRVGGGGGGGALVEAQCRASTARTSQRAAMSDLQEQATVSSLVGWGQLVARESGVNPPGTAVLCQAHPRTV